MSNNKSNIQIIAEDYDDNDDNNTLTTMLSSNYIYRAITPTLPIVHICNIEHELLLYTPIYATRIRPMECITSTTLNSVKYHKYSIGSTDTLPR